MSAIALHTARKALSDARYEFVVLAQEQGAAAHEADRECGFIEAFALAFDDGDEPGARRQFLGTEFGRCEHASLDAAFQALADGYDVDDALDHVLTGEAQTLAKAAIRNRDVSRGWAIEQSVRAKITAREEAARRAALRPLRVVEFA